MSDLGLRDLLRCFEGAIPVVLVTASAAGVPNVTYLSKAHVVDDERIALSNQFLSKSAKNLAENPRASLLLMEPTTHDEYRLSIAFERTERRGRVFDGLKAEVDAIAAYTGMQDVFRLRAADVYRVTKVERVPPNERADGTAGSALVATPPVRTGPDAAGLGELCGRIARCGDLDTLVRVTVDGLAELLGYEHSMLLLLDEDGRRLFTLACARLRRRGHRVGGARRRRRHRPRRPAGGCRQRRQRPPDRQVREVGARVLRGVRRHRARPGGGPAGVGLRRQPGGGADAGAGAVGGGVDGGGGPGGALRRSRRGVAVGRRGARRHGDRDDPGRGAGGDGRRGSVGSPGPAPAPAMGEGTTHVRFFTIDGSTFLDGDYVIKGVAGRLLWTLLRQYESEGRTDFTNREVRLDPSLDLPDFRDNFESRLILLKRRLDERDAPIRIEKTGRGKFRLVVSTGLRLEEGAS